MPDSKDPEAPDWDAIFAPVTELSPQDRARKITAKLEDRVSQLRAAQSNTSRIDPKFALLPEDIGNLATGVALESELDQVGAFATR